MQNDSPMATEVPCIKTKCLLYPACKSKLLIDCEILRAHFDHLFSSYNSRTVWKSINEELPRLKSIISSERELNKQALETIIRENYYITRYLHEKNHNL